MTDSAPIDPDRPWIDDPADAPAAMQWFPSFFSPLGETPRLHFTRAWTILFFSRVLAFILPLVALAVLLAAGANDPSSLLPPAWFFPLFVLVTALMSAVLHTRRLNNARRSPLWAVIVLIPVTVGLVGFLLGGIQGGQQYAAAVDELNNPTPAVERSEGGQAEGESEENEDGGGRGGREEEPLNVTEISAREHAFSSALQTAQAFWAIPSFLVMLWTLLWVGRLPNGGGTIRDRVRGVQAAGSRQPL